MTLKPLADRVVVKLVEAEETTKTDVININIPEKILGQQVGSVNLENTQDYKIHIDIESPKTFINGKVGTNHFTLVLPFLLQLLTPGPHSGAIP